MEIYTIVLILLIIYSGGLYPGGFQFRVWFVGHRPFIILLFCQREYINRFGVKHFILYSNRDQVSPIGCIRRFVRLYSKCLVPLFSFVLNYTLLGTIVVWLGVYTGLKCYHLLSRHWVKIIAFVIVSLSGINIMLFT